MVIFGTIAAVQDTVHDGYIKCVFRSSLLSTRNSSW